MASPTFEDEDVATVFSRNSEPVRTQLLALRQLIFDVAANTDGVGKIFETLKWGQVSYLTPQTKSGTTIRIAADASHDGDYALYVSCNTNLVEAWREQYPTLNFGGTRSLHFRLDEELPLDAVRHCVAMALTYHARKKTKAS